MKKIRVMIVEDSPVVAALLEYCVGSDPRLEVCATAGSAEEALDTFEEIAPDVIAMGKLFDVYSHNMYSATPDPARVQRYYNLTGRPLLIGEFHNGTPGRGMAPPPISPASEMV